MIRARRIAGQKARQMTKEEKKKLEMCSKWAKEQNADFIARTTEYHRAENKYLMYDEPALLDMYSELTKHLKKGVLQMSLVDFLTEEKSVEMQPIETVSQIGVQQEKQVTDDDDEDGLNWEQKNDVDFEPAEIEELSVEDPEEEEEQEQDEEHEELRPKVAELEPPKRDDKVKRVPEPLMPQTEENVLHQNNQEVPLLGALSIDNIEIIEDIVEIRSPPIHKAVLSSPALPPSKPPRADASTTTDSLQLTNTVSSSFQSINSERSENLRPRNVRALTVETSMGNKHLVVPKLPTIIAPRMKAKDKVIPGRVLEGNELGFSINGSPLVAAPTRRHGEGIAEVVDQALSCPEAELTPMTRNLATALKAALRSKFNNP